MTPTRRLHTLLFGLLLLLGGGLASPLSAQLLLYDDFAADRLDPARWRAASRGAGSAVYELTRQVHNGALVQALRTYGSPLDDVGLQEGGLAITLDGSPTALQWDTTVHGYLLQGCPNPGAQPSALQVDLRVPLFNDGTRLSPEDQTGNVDVRVRLVRRTDSPDPPELVPAVGLMTRCAVPDCSARDILGEVPLGPVVVGQPSTFLLFWDTFRALVEIQLNGAPVAALPYALPVVVVLGGGRTWQVVALGANCTAAPRPFAEVSASLDNVFVFTP